MTVHASEMAERKDMLILAQQKLDEINRGNLGLSSGGRPGSASSNRRRSNAISSHLLSTLLYVALLSHKIEDMKIMLEEEDGVAYDEWRCLLENIHSPEFHSRERIMQNGRVKKTFERKRRYKEEASRLRKELADTSNKLAELQKLTNETNHNMSSTIASFQAERAALVSKDEELREKMSEVRRSADQTEMEIKSVQSTLAEKEKLLDERNARIEELEKELCQFKQDAAVANTKLDRAETKLEETHSKLVVSEAKYADYQAKTEPIVSQLRQDLTEANGKLAAANESLDTAKQSLEESKRTIGASLSTFSSDVKGQSENLKDLIKSEVSKLDERFAVTNCDLQRILAHNEDVTTSLAALPNISKQIESVEESAGETNSLISTTVMDELQQGMRDMKQKLEDASSRENANDALHRDLEKVQKQLDGIVNYQKQTDTREELLRITSALDELSKSHQQGVNVRELLDELLEIQKKQGSSTENRLDNITETLKSSARLNDDNRELLQKVSTVVSTVDAISDECAAIKSDLKLVADQDRGCVCNELSMPKSTEMQPPPEHSADQLVDGYVLEAMHNINL